MRTIAVGVLCLILGALLALMWKDTPAPTPLACPECPSCAPTVAVAAHDRVTRPRARTPAKKSASDDKPLPLAVDTDAHKERLRDWFADHAASLVECVQKGEPRRRLLVRMKIEPDGSIVDATILGADDLRPDSASCVQKRVTQIRMPKEDLRGRETLLVYVNL
jgi:hypothetical protein